MKISDIRKMPTIWPLGEGPGCHESVMRAFQILQKVKDYLERGVPADVLLELIEEMESPIPEPEEVTDEMDK